MDKQRDRPGADLNRRALSILIVLLWAAGFAWMVRRNLGGDVNRRLTEAAVRVQPATFYYSVSYRGAKIGAAASAIDTLPAALVSEEYYTGSFPSGDSLAPVSARLRSRLSRGFRLTDISVQLDRNGRSSKMSAFVQGDTTLVVIDGNGTDSTKQHIIGLHGPLLPPTLVGIALVLGEKPRTGLGERFVLFDPMAAKPEWHRVRIVAESLFTVVDSAGHGKDGGWSAAHTDTVRAWRLGGDTRGLAVWVDAEGRVVEAAAPNGLLLRRTAYELAFERARVR